MVRKKSSSLGIEAPKKYILLAFHKDKNNYHLSLSLISEAPLITLIQLIPKEVSNDLTPLLNIMFLESNLIKHELININNIFTFTGIQGSLNPNQIILQDKIKNRLGKSLKV